MQAVIPCGGLGTRLRPLTLDTPKSMVDVAGRPFLEWQIQWLQEHGIDDVVLCIGHLGEQIQDYFGDGSSHDISIRYAMDEHMDVYGAVKNARVYLDDTFMLLYGDSYPVRLDIRDFWANFIDSGSLMMIAAYINHDNIDSSNLLVEDEMLVDVDCENANAIDIGATMLSRAALQYIPDVTPFSTADMRRVMHRHSLLDVYQVMERFYHIGNMEALKMTEKVIQ